MSYKKLSIKVKENSPTSSPLAIHVDNPTQAEIDTWVKAADKLTLGLTLGVTLSETVPLPTPLLTKSAPKTAQRGQKILVSGRCSVADDPLQKIYHHTIPTANTLYIAVAGSDKIDMTQKEVAAYIAATNAMWKNENGKAIVVFDMDYVNRNVQ